MLPVRQLVARQGCCGCCLRPAGCPVHRLSASAFPPIEPLRWSFLAWAADASFRGGRRPRFIPANGILSEASDAPPSPLSLGAALDETPSDKMVSYRAVSFVDGGRSPSIRSP